MNLKKLSSIITNTRFSREGLVITESDLLVPVYVASQFGFNEPGREFLERFYERCSRSSVNAGPVRGAKDMGATRR